MSTTLEEIEAAYIAARQRVFHSGTRAVATPEQRQAWGQEFRDTIAKVKAAAQVEALREFRQELLEHQLESYGVILPNVHGVLDDLAESADRIARTAGIDNKGEQQ